MCIPPEIGILMESVKLTSDPCLLRAVEGIPFRTHQYPAFMEMHQSTANSRNKGRLGVGNISQ